MHLVAGPMKGEGGGLWVANKETRLFQNTEEKKGSKGHYSKHNY